MKSVKRRIHRPGSPGRFFLTAAVLVAILIGTLWAASLDRTEVTNRKYLEFLLATGRPPLEHWKGTQVPKDAEEQPVVLVTWFDARDYCAWKSKRLPSREEWGAACSSEGFQKKGNVWEWTRTEEPNGWKVLCGPIGVCDCTHRYRPEWKNAVKGFRCVGDTPVALLPQDWRPDTP